MRHDLALTSIPNMVRVSAREHRDAIAIVDGDAQYTYTELEAAMLDSTRAMIALGVEPGDRVALCGPNSASWIIAALGIQGAGGVLIPVNTRFRGQEIGHLLTKGDATAFVTVGEFLGNDYVDMVRTAVPQARALERIVILDDTPVDGTTTFAEAVRRGRESVSVEAAEAAIAAVQGDHLSDIMFTSGTTGSPKGVMLTHAQSLRAYGDMADILELRSDDCILVIPPFFHAFGYKAGWMMGLMKGMRVIPQRTFDAEDIMHKIQTHRVSCVFGPPTIFVDVMSHPRFKEFDLSSLRVTTVSAAAIPVSLIHDLKSVLGFEVVLSGYGLTEATAIVTVSRPSDDAETVANRAGRPFPDVEVKAVDVLGNDLAPGEEGELLVHGYNVMQGYWREPDQTAAAITSDGWLKTGDIGFVDERGYVKVTDRMKDMFIVGGFNAYPAEIEDVLMRFEKIQHAAVVGIPDARMGEVGAAYVVPAPGYELTQEEVVAYARENLANFKVPREIHIVDDLPRNASMKVLKHVLKQERLREASPS